MIRLGYDFYEGYGKLLLTFWKKIDLKRFLNVIVWLVHLFGLFNVMSRLIKTNSVALDK